jgi:uncharacterized protein YjiS (DUF1127 family)
LLLVHADPGCFWHERVFLGIFVAYIKSSQTPFSCAWSPNCDRNPRRSTMTTFTRAHNHSDRDAFAIRPVLIGFVRDLASMYDRRQARVRSVAHLSELDDHMLKDIGLYRYQIFDAVHGRDGYRRTGADRRHPMEF